MCEELKAIEILRTIKEGNFIPYLNENLIYIDEAINELEQYEQNFKQKEFDYRTQCQSILSTGRIEADNIAIAELENLNKEIDIAKEEIKYAITKPQYAEVYLNNAIGFLDKIQSNYKNK